MKQASTIAIIASLAAVTLADGPSIYERIGKPTVQSVYHSKQKVKPSSSSSAAKPNVVYTCQSAINRVKNASQINGTAILANQSAWFDSSFPQVNN